ncbi:MAG: M28 family peptidase [Saprospiraceae bacterium]|nr:M28 family peptidase [Saprospiraceae bacterium]
MKQNITLLVLAILSPFYLTAQTNILSTNPLAQQILTGNYEPSDYAATAPIVDPAAITAGIQARVSADSLKAYIIHLSQFGNRNTGADTLSASTGMGAARRWVYQQFEAFSAANEGRLLVSYLQFDQAICGMGQHRNIMAVLPGSNPTRNGVILIEGHIDSRCSELCDLDCLAEGVEDNASGTALVMELARVMSAYTFENTIVFMATIGEEQGLMGAEAFGQYIQNNGIPLRAVLNNDVVGGVICGKTSSPPSCSGLNEVDSTSVRLFSQGGANSKHKQLARFIKLEYQEQILPTATVPMNLRIMTPEDRTGRGGDHIPFRQKGYTAMRFTAANEHGDASNGAGYTDRQHSSDDILGIDTDGDQVIDSFFVQFNYLARNAVINGAAAAIAAQNVPTPVNFTAIRSNAGKLIVDITDPANLGMYRVALRSTTHDWDTVYTLIGASSGSFDAPPAGVLYVSVAGVDGNGSESLFSGEKLILVTGVAEAGAEENAGIQLFQNRPKPFDEATWISFWVNEQPAYREASIQITDSQGKIIQHLPVQLQVGLNEVMYTHGYGVRGTFAYTLLIDGRVIDARQMIFAN